MKKTALALSAALVTSSLTPDALAGPEPTGFQMDGVLDAGALLNFSNGTMSLHTALRGGRLYVATNAAGNGRDHFVFITGSTTNLVPAPQNKAGLVALWAAYLFDENDDNSSGWFDAEGAWQSASGSSGGVVEGTLDFTANFSTMPVFLRAAVGVYGTADGGTLVPSLQVPASFDNNGTLDSAEFGAISLPLGWVNVGTGSWLNDFNWTFAAPNGIGATARFGEGVRSPAGVTVDSPVTVKTIELLSPSPVTISGSADLTLDASSGFVVITVGQGRHEISAPLVIKDDLSLSVFGIDRTITFSGPITYTSGITAIHSGTGIVHINGPVTAGAGARLSVVDGATSVTTDLAGLNVSVDSILTMRGPQHLASLEVKFASRVILTDTPATNVLRTPSLDVGGRFDITDNGVIVDYTTNSPFHPVREAIVRGYNNGAWNGRGILSVNALTNSKLAVGYAEASAIGASETFLGEDIDNTTVLVRLTLAGDADLSGGVNLADFARLGANFNNPAVWTSGDFNYDGTANVGDFALLASNFNQAMPRAAAVPEPAASALLLAAAGLRRPRRR